MELKLRKIWTSPDSDIYILRAYVYSERMLDPNLSLEDFNEICKTAKCGLPRNNGFTYVDIPFVKARGHRAIVYQLAGEN